MNCDACGRKLQYCPICEELVCYSCSHRGCS